MILDTAAYADGRRVACETLEEAFRARHGSNTFAAVALHEPDQKELNSIIVDASGAACASATLRPAPGRRAGATASRTWWNGRSKRKRRRPP